jgi:hypothetical protein
MTTSAKSAKEESDRIILRHRDELQSELSAITARALAAEAALEALEAQVAALSAEPSEDDAVTLWDGVRLTEQCKAALTAFLRRRSQP